MQRIDEVEERTQVLLVDARLAVLLREVDLHEDVLALADLARLLVEGTREVLRIDGVDQAEVLDGLLRLVGLQVADEMPGDIAVEDIEFALGLLDAVLTDAVAPASMASRMASTS